MSFPWARGCVCFFPSVRVPPGSLGLLQLQGPEAGRGCPVLSGYTWPSHSGLTDSWLLPWHLCGGSWHAPFFLEDLPSLSPRL